MSIASSFSTICTKNCKQELIGFLLSLSIHHKDANVYIMCDTETKENYDIMSFKPSLNIKWFITLDKYSNYNRIEMEKLNIWSEFQMAKSLVLDEALKYENDCLFLDSDTIITYKLSDIDHTKELGVSPGFINKETYEKYGYYNGGMIWVKNKNIPKQWREYTLKSRYFDQASIEDLYSFYKKENKVFEFDDTYNLQTWRFIVGNEDGKTISSYLIPDPKNNLVLYKNKPLKFIHTHFNMPKFENLNNFFISNLIASKMYRELLSIFRCKYNKWIITIPKQPMNGLGFHKNDSFRQLPILLKKNYKDIDIMLDSNSIHCKIMPNIILYDRPTLEWINSECNFSSLLLLGNGDINIEGKIIKNNYMNLNIKPWIFWPRNPMLVEKILSEDKRLLYNERNIMSIFIGNIENNVQKQFRNDNNWQNVIEEFYITNGKKHLFTNKEYLLKIKNSKFGLCLRGYGSKCHREVELMAFGTVPIITKNVNIDSYMDKPIENIHYIYAENPDDLITKINNIDEKKWEYMSKKCYEWYEKNVNSKNLWHNMLNNNFYI